MNRFRRACLGTTDPVEKWTVDANFGPRDAAWARLVRAECDVAMENAPCPSAETLAERDGARQALRDLGVNVDALLGDAPGEPRPSTAGRIELHAKEYKGRLRGILVDASETRAYLGGLADAAVIARGGRARLPEGDP